MKKQRARASREPPKKEDKGASTRVLLALGALVVLIAYLISWATSRSSGPDVHAGASSSSSTSPGKAPSHVPGAPLGPMPQGSELESIDDLPPTPEGLDQPTSGAMLPLPPGPRPYPPGSQPLTEGVDPATTAKEDDAVDEKTGIHVVFGPRLEVVHPPDPIVIDLEVLDKAGKHLAIGDPVARFRPDRTSVDSGPWFSSAFHEDSALRYTATYYPSAAEQDALRKGGSHVFVEVTFEAPNGLGPRKYACVTMYGRQPNAELNHKFADARSNGSLLVQVGVKASAAGKYRVIGSLYGPDGSTAIAFGSANADLPAGDGILPLTFFGKILYDKGIDGPYVLRYLMLFELDPSGDEVPGVTVDPAYTTAFYKASEFSPDSYKPPPPDYAVVNADSPSQKDKPPPIMEHRPPQPSVAPPPQGQGSGAPSAPSVWSK